MIKSLTAVLLFTLSISCTVHAQTSQPQTLKYYLALTNSFLQDDGKWIRQNKDFIPGDTNSASYYALEFYRSINANTVQLKLKNYLPLQSEWKMIGELILSWNAKKQKVVVYGIGSDGIIISGESELITSSELRLVSSSVSAKGITEESKEVFSFREGKIEVNSLMKINNTWREAIPLTFTRMEQPSGNLTFMSTRDGNFEIYSMDTKGENLKNLSCNKAMDYAFSYTPDKRLVFYTNRDGNDEVYVMDADGKKATNITNHAAADRIPCVSPDGKQVLFLSDREDKNGKIYSIDIDGKNLRRLTNNSYFEDAPTWSYDGKKIVFSRELKDLKDTSRNAVRNGEIFIMDADGTNEIQLTNRPGYDGGPQISPDGKRVAFYGKSEKNKYDIFLMDIDGENIINLTEDDVEDYSPSWSPDGKWIACTRGDSKNYDVWIINLETKIKTRVTTQPKRDENPFWQTGK
jgi:TolB protein